MPLRLKHHISTESWIPEQHIPSLELRKRDDFHCRLCLKYSGEGYFLSKAQSWHAALLESDINISSYVPHPIKFRVGSRYFTPYNYVIKNYKKILIDFISIKDLHSAWIEDLSAVINSKGIVFEFISKESVYERQQLAENWITITNYISMNRHRNTDELEFSILHYQLMQPLSFGDLLSDIEPYQRNDYELAIFRLLHRGQITANLNFKVLDYDTEFQLCI